MNIPEGYRKIDSPWISARERLPAEKDFYFVQFNYIKGGSAWWNGNGWDDAKPLGPTIIDELAVVAWMPIPKAVEPIEPPKPSNQGGQTHELICNKDGSIKAGCVTIDNETMGKIIVRRMEAKS